MVLKKENFYDLGIFDLMQNVWCCVDTMTERGGKTPQFIYGYCCWNEDILREKWPESGDLPSCKFVIDRLRKQEEEFYPGPTDNREDFMEFLRKVKKDMLVVKNVSKK